jgi:oxalate decarboxylase
VSLGGTNGDIDSQNPDNLVGPSTDAGTVPNLKWSFSDSKTKIYPGGWVREQTSTDLASSTTLAGAQLHMNKGAVRELHWHRAVCGQCMVHWRTMLTRTI